MNELRLTVAKTIDRFVIELDESYSEEKYRSEWRDYFTVMIGTIEMRFLPRK